MLVALALVLGVAVTATGRTAAEAAPVPLGEWSFAMSRPDFRFTDARTKFDAQVNTAKSSRTMAWDIRLTPALRTISTGKMLCITTIAGLKGYRDEHLVSTAYTLHSSAPGHKFNKTYTLNGTCTFPVKVGSRKGKATLQYAFKYNLYSVIRNREAAPVVTVDTTGSAAKAKAKKPMVSKVKYKYKKKKK